MTFRLGDKVRHITGGKPMTVSAIVDDDLQWDLGMNEHIRAEVGDILCEWKEGKKLKRAVFREASLEAAQKETGKP